MEKTNSNFKARSRVITGFILAILLIVVVSIITFFSVSKLLNTVEALAEPSDRLRQLNGLLADIYQLDRAQGRVETDSAEELNYLQKIENRLLELESYSTDSAEVSQLKKISYNVNELLLVYNGLDEVKYNLINRNFSREALKNIETKIRRQEELNRHQSIGRIRVNSPVRRTLNERNLPESDTSPRRARRDTLSSPTAELLTPDERANLRQIFSILNINPNRGDTTLAALNQTRADSILYAVRNTVLEINSQEQQLRSQLAALEYDLQEKNKVIIADIQTVITSLQRAVLADARSQNHAAYDLTFNVSILLGVLIIIGVIGSSAFIYSILSEINKAQEYRQRLEEAKLRSDNLAKAKQYFLANMSHEIRNPLHAIQGYNEALQKTILDKDQKGYVDMVSFASQTLSSIVNDILDLSKLEAGKITIDQRPFDQHKFFSTIRDFFKMKVEEKNLQFIWEATLPENKWLEGDELRLNQILNNLISNAYKFTDKGSIHVAIQYEDGNLLMTVADTGMGMSKDIKENLFQEFNQGDSSITRKFGGTGLGLSIVKKLVEHQNGQISYESEIGKGTTFKVVLPALLVDPIKEACEEVTYALDGIKVLLIDDDKIGIRFAQLLLESNGAIVTKYIGGLAFVKNFVPQHFDIALVDIQMPEISGYDVLKRLRKEHGFKDLPILAITANVFAEEKEKLSEYGFDGILLKPFKENELKKAIAETIGLLPLDTLKMENTAGQSQSYSLEDLEKFCMGDKDLLGEVLFDYYHETLNNLEEISSALSKDDYQAILEIAHKLSSRLGQLKISASALARDIEIDIKNDRFENVIPQVNKLVTETEAVMEELMKNEKIEITP
ncbi:ATP-binding protein [Anditalea andensis]|uniref:histidine kinase n=1 Tax=Anditalea andensis TaxID=1048983 RepID=A0A074LKV3_9BACT|nr:ATP-binding protein [Anditalea andensis]KEO74472.1 histidine kinase [Anditalea andensis]